MKGKTAALLAFFFVVACAWIGPADAQTGGSAPPALRQQIEQRFDVLTVQDGLVLRPKTPMRDVRWIEVADGMIRVDGVPVSGGELRSRLGDTAGLVLQLSYLEPAARTALFRDRGAASPVQTPAPVETAPARTRESEGQFRLGGSITVPADERVSGDVVVVGGSIHVFGEVRGDVVAIGGVVELGPQSAVRDVTVIGGSLRRDPSARVSGEVVEVGAPGASSAAAARSGFPRNRMREVFGGGGRGSGFAFLFTLVRIAVLCLLAALVVLLGKDYIDRIGDRAAAEPLKAGAIGLLAQLLVVPVLIVTIVLLVVTIIGIPLLVLIPFIVVGLAVVALVGFTSVAHYAGGLVNARFGWDGRGPYATTLLGILLFVSPLVLARLVGLGGAMFPISLALIVIGTIVEYLAWTVGFGAAALARFSRPNRPATTP